jgi:two-component system cell cycle response regulator CpdR
MHKILLAEDDNDMRRFLVKALENAGFQVITGFAAVALNSDSEAPKNAKVLSKPVHLRELVSEVNKMLAA